MGEVILPSHLSPGKAGNISLPVACCGWACNWAVCFPWWFYLNSPYFRVMVCKGLLWYSHGLLLCRAGMGQPRKGAATAAGDCASRQRFPSQALCVPLIWPWPQFAPSPAHNVIKILTVHSEVRTARGIILQPDNICAASCTNGHLFCNPVSAQSALQQETSR